MRRTSRTALVLLLLSGVGCAVDRNGDGSEAVGEAAGNSPADNGESGGSSASGGTGGSSPGVVELGGSAGVFGVATGNAGGDTDPSNEDHEAGASGKQGSGTVEPTDSGSVAVDVTIAKEASTVSACASHAGGQTFTPDGATGPHCYWPHAAKSGWQAAVDACKGEGGHLATVTSAPESTFVIKLIPNFGTDARLWLGGTDNKLPSDESGGGPYVWITGEPFTYAPWAAMNPDGACDNTCNGQRCCQHRVCADNGGVFWDREEAELYYSVCESEP